MFTEGIYPIGDGLLDIDEDRLKGLLVPHDINDIYDVEQTPFARGKFAAVRRAVHKNSGVHFAAKFLKRRRRAQSSDKEIKHEIAVLMLCDGADNIVKLNAVHESRSDTALLLELATGGELQTFLDNEECLNEAQARICMREVLKALQFLHKRSIAHLDLKPQNILLTGERIEDGLKLCDFGISRVVAEGTNVREIVGTPDYVAPEVLQYEPLSLLTDIWSVGVLAYVLLSGFSPFGGETKQETFLNISQCALTFPDKLFGGVSAAAVDFMRRAMRIKPSDRMTAAGCLEHIWLKDELPIDRQMFEAEFDDDATADNDDEERDESVDDDEDDDEDEREDNEGDDGVSADDNNVVNGSSNSKKMHAGNACQRDNSSGSAPTSTPNDNTAADTTKTTMTTTTAIHTVPATRATTIPLCSNVLHQQQQQLLNVTRRHSSDSNKENTFLAMKKIAPPTTTTALATIFIAPTELATATSTNIAIATITPLVINNDAAAAAAAAVTQKAQCIFPDAPTTPKVIRKAPHNDTSPTSVKALVKKFQLEGVNAEKHAAQHLKETQQQQTDKITNSNRKSVNGSVEQNKKFGQSLANCNKTSINNSNHSKSINSNSNSNTNKARRASEPITHLHHHQKQSATASTPSAAATTSAASYKSTCVFCLSCGGSNTTTGCRHTVITPASPTSKISSTISSNGSGANGGGGTALLFSNHHHQQQQQQQQHAHHLQHPHHNQHQQHNHNHNHHHQHHHQLSNNLSLDQGIIC